MDNFDYYGAIDKYSNRQWDVIEPNEQEDGEYEGGDRENDKNDKTDKTSAPVRQLSNFCPECDVAMTLRLCSDEYQCPQCSSISAYDGGVSNVATNSNSFLKFQTGGRVKYFSSTMDYSVQQRKEIRTQLKNNSILHKGCPIPVQILERTTETYNEIQKLDIVKRAETKDELLAAVLYYECVQGGVIRKKKDICDFMRLRKHGFSNGEKLIRELCLEKRLSYLIIDEQKEKYVDLTLRYMECLGMKIGGNHDKFVFDMIKHSDNFNVAINSLISTKISALLWILRNNFYVQIDQDAFEKVVECKKTTFDKILKDFVKFEPIFRDLFAEFSINPVAVVVRKVALVGSTGIVSNASK